MAAMDTVLIVGAGPIGMTLALQLHSYGVPVRLIDKSTERRGGSKALTVNPSTLYIFEMLGVASQVIDRGRRLNRATVLWRGHRLTAVSLQRLAYRHNHLIMLPQPVTEEILSARLQEVGVEIEREVALVDVQSTEAGVTAVMLCPNGTTIREKYAYLVGCDGARSVVRQRLGIPFNGFDYPMHFLLADVRVEWDGPMDEAFYFVEDSAFLVLLPLTGQHHRIVVSVEGRLDEKGSVTFDDVKDAVNACVGERLHLSDPIWVSSAPIYNRLASALSGAGKVFLAGDAAHLFSPIGGSGMNTGIGDAFNLGWKLAYVMKGHSDAKLLRSYEGERLALAQRLVSMTDHLTSLISRHAPKDEERWLPQARNRPNLRTIPYHLAGFSHCYDDGLGGLAGRAVRPKSIAPFIDVILPSEDERRLWQGKHILVVNGRSLGKEWPRWAEALAQIRDSFDAIVKIVVFVNPQLRDCLGERVAWRANVAALDACSFPDPGVALIRPDFFVEMISTGGDACGDALLALTALYIIDREEVLPNENIPGR